MGPFIRNYRQKDRGVGMFLQLENKKKIIVMYANGGGGGRFGYAIRLELGIHVGKLLRARNSRGRFTPPFQVTMWSICAKGVIGVF